MRLLKTILFHILMTFRSIFLGSFQLLSKFFIFAFVLMLLMGGQKIPLMMKVLSFSLGVGFAALSWYYDLLVLKLQPENIDLSLFQ